MAGGRGSADAVRDPRGFAVKFYTEDGNYDLVGNNTPIFFIRDPLKFPDFIHSQKPDPYTNHQEPDNVWDFFSHSPEATHMFTWLFGDRGIPASYRHMDGFSSHTYQWVNAEGEAVWVKYHFKTDQGIRCLDSSEAAELAGLNPDSHQLDLVEAIERGEFPSWTVKVQIMPVDEAAAYRVNPFDLTKVWSQKDYPLIEVGRLTLDRNADNYFGDVEQSGIRSGQLRPRYRALARQDAPGPAVRLRRRPPLPLGHQPHPAAGQRAARHRGPQLRARRTDGRPRQRWPGQELRAQQLRRARSRPTSPMPLRWRCTARRGPSTGTTGRPTTSPRPATSTGCSRPMPRPDWSTTSPVVWDGVARPDRRRDRRAEHRPLPGG